MSARVRAQALLIKIWEIFEHGRRNFYYGCISFWHDFSWLECGLLDAESARRRRIKLLEKLKPLNSKALERIF